MAVILDLSLPADQFELGRLLQMDAEASVSLETLVPLGEESVPFFRFQNGSPEVFESSVRKNDAVRDIHVVSTHNGETLFALEWEVSRDTFFAGLNETSGHILDASGTVDDWRFEIRFPSHETVSSFHSHCLDHDIPIDILRVYNPTKPDAGPWFGLTAPQREMLTRAVDAGYYSIPRRISTRELADEFDISDQAVTERLRRAIISLTSNTLLISAEGD